MVQRLYQYRRKGQTAGSGGRIFFFFFFLNS
jgi:hypothetical protein